MTSPLHQIIRAVLDRASATVRACGYDVPDNITYDEGQMFRAGAETALDAAADAAIRALPVDQLAAELAHLWPWDDRLSAVAKEAEEAARLMDFLLPVLAEKLPEADIYQLRRVRDFAECAAKICKEDKP